MKRLKKYIEEIEEEIKEHIDEECEKVTDAGEEILHCLFENRKHAIEFLAEMQAEHGDARRAGMPGV